MSDQAKRRSGTVGAEPPIRLRVALVWGTTIVAVQELSLGQTLVPGPGWPRAGTSLGASPLGASGRGWEVRGEGTVGGLVREASGEREVTVGLRARAEQPGDLGLLQYGALSLFYEVVATGTPCPRAPEDRVLLWGLGFALIVVVGGLGLVWQLTARAEPVRADVPVTPRQPRGRYIVPEPSVGPLDPHEGPAAQQRTLAAALGLVSIPKATGGLERSEVNAGFLANVSRVQGCYIVARARRPSLQGAVELIVTITPAGKIDQVELSASSLLDPELERCVADQARGVTFPPRSAPTRAVYSFRFDPPTE